MTHLRHYVRVYDDVLDEEKIASIYDAVAPFKADAVDIPGLMRYKFKPISPLDAFNDWRRLSFHFCTMLTQYKARYRDPARATLE